MCKKIKLRFFINTLSGGGAEKVLVDLLNGLDSEKFDLSLVTIETGTHAARLPGHVDFKCLTAGSCGMLKRVFEKILYKFPPGIFSRLFLRGNYDIEIAYLEGTPTRYIAKKKHSKKIAFVHCDFSANNVVDAFYKTKDRCFKEYSLFDKVCFVSKMSKQGFEKTVGKLNNSCIIHNVVDYDMMKILASEKSTVEFKTNGVKLITIGRLVKEKGYDRLLRVVARLERDYDFELLIIGEGEQREFLESIAVEKHIKSVKFVGFQKNPYSYLNNSDLFICSSYTEGYSTVVTEAISLGVPVITTDCAGMDEILSDGKYGLIIENTEEMLYSCLKRVFEDKMLLSDLKKKALERSAELELENSMTKYIELFDSLV